MYFMFVFFYLQSTLHLDINECTGSKKVCTDNATCTNTAGGFYCTCNAGFTDTLEDGSQCEGKCFQVKQFWSKNIWRKNSA